MPWEKFMIEATGRHREFPGSNAEILMLQTSELSFEALLRFVHKLRSSYPDKKYPDDTVLGRTEFSPQGKSSRAFVASEKNEEIGIITGEEDGENFDLDWLFVLPEYQNGAVSRKLFDKVFEKYKIVRLLASTYGGSRDESPELHAQRQRTLIGYYEKLGFIPNKEADSYPYSNMPGAPTPMIWKKKEDAK